MTALSRSLLRAALFVSCGLTVGGSAAPSLPGDMKEWGLKSIDLVYRENFREAEQEVRRIIREYPDHPSGYFFFAAVLDARMERYGTDAEENEFYRLCDAAVSKGERLLERQPDDLWAKFFVAGANGAKGAYESRFERWITAFRHGWQGVSLFREILDRDSTMWDGFYGIGLYDYWRSAMTKLLWWMPGVEDKRDEAVEMIKTARRKGVFVREAAAAELLPILCNEGDYIGALRLADEVIVTYPQCLAFRWGRAEALLGLERYAEAEKESQHILERLSADLGTVNTFGLMRCHLFLAKAYAGLGRDEEAVKSCAQVVRLKVSDALEKQAELFRAEAEKIQRKARRSLAGR